jgi:hypothetical protein
VLQFILIAQVMFTVHLRGDGRVIQYQLQRQLSPFGLSDCMGMHSM